MYLKREIEQEVLEMVGQYPVLTITGPKQSGKTTLVKHLFGYLPYYNFESPDTRRLVESDPRAFCSRTRKGQYLMKSRISRN
jgi:predicted AAA+ superfamily ATPase